MVVCVQCDARISQQMNRISEEQKKKWLDELMEDNSAASEEDLDDTWTQESEEDSCDAEAHDREETETHYCSEDICRYCTEGNPEIDLQREGSEREWFQDIANRFQRYTAPPNSPTRKTREAPPSKSPRRLFLRFSMCHNEAYEPEFELTDDICKDYWYDEKDIDTFQDRAIVAAESLLPIRPGKEGTEEIISDTSEVLLAVYRECCKASSEDEDTKKVDNLECLRKLYIENDLFGLEHVALSQTRGCPRLLTRFVLNYNENHREHLKSIGTNKQHGKDTDGVVHIPTSELDQREWMLAQTSRTTSRSSRVFARESAIAQAMAVFGHQAELFASQLYHEPSMATSYNQY